MTCLPKRQRAHIQSSKSAKFNSLFSRVLNHGLDQRETPAAFFHRVLQLADKYSRFDGPCGGVSALRGQNAHQSWHNARQAIRKTLRNHF